ncbi:MAG: MBL fold metallo-hydrolase [Halioglobus sp.]
MLKWVGVLLVVLLAALAIFLIPQHLQIRGVQPTIPTVEELLGIEHPDGPSALYYINSAEQALERGALAHSVFVFEWPDGKLFLVDASMREQQALAFADLMRNMSGGGEAMLHGNVAQLLGNAASRVAGIGFTHLHIDHTEGVVALCEAIASSPLLLQTPYQQSEHNFNTREGAALLQSSCLKRGELTEGVVWTSEKFPGLGIIPAGGHTPGSTLFVASIQGQHYVLSGDITNAKAAILADTGKGWVYSNLLVTEDTQRTAQLREWLRSLVAHEAFTVVVSHDLQDIHASGLPEFSAANAMMVLEQAQ